LNYLKKVNFKKIKVLIPIGAFYPANTGGPSNTMYWHARALQSLSVCTTVVTTNRGIDPRIVPVNTWINNDAGMLYYAKTRIHYLPLNLLLKSISKLCSHDIVHLTSLFHPPSYLIAIVALLMKKSVIWSVRGTLFESALSNKSNFFKRLAILFHKLVFVRHIIYHGTSHIEKNQIIERLRPKHKPVCLPNYIQESELEHHNSEKKYFLYVGRIAPIKAIDDLIKGFFLNKYFMSNDDWSLLIAGESEDGHKKRLEELIGDLKMNHKVQFLGKIQGREKEKLYANAYFTCLVSHSENFGNVVIESFMQGTPAIISKNCPWSIVEDNNLGDWIFNDPASIAESIDKVLSLDEQEYQRMRNRVRKFALDQYSIEANIHKWISTYSTVNCFN